MRFAAAAVLIACLGGGLGAQWPQWRGPNRDGIVPAALAPSAWPDKPSLKWKHPAGEGYSSPVVHGGRVFLHSRRDPDEIVSALDLASGKTLWTASYAAPFNKNQYARAMAKGPFSTPLAAGDRVYTLGVTGVLSAFDAAGGRLVWRKDFSRQVDTSKLFTGSAMSPMIAGGALIVHVGDDTNGAFYAFDPANGSQKWTLPGHGPGYASPVLVTAAGTPQIVTMSDKAVVAVDMRSGALLWSLPFPDEWHENIVTPVVAGDVLVISGTRKGTFGYRIERKGQAWTPRQLWHNADLPMYMSTPVADGSFLYGFSNRRKGQLFCMDAATGAARWTTEGRTARNASLVSAGAALLVLTTDGELIVANRRPERYEEVKRYKVSEAEIWAHPAIAGTDIVVRDVESIAAWSFR